MTKRSLIDISSMDMEHSERRVEKSGLKLPRGQLTHVLRHTFASHFMMNGGNILVLQKILGHSKFNYDDALCTLGPGTLARSQIIKSYNKTLDNYLGNGARQPCNFTARNPTVMTFHNRHEPEIQC